MDTLTYDAGAVTAVIGYTQAVRRVAPERFHKWMVFVACAFGILYAISFRPGKHRLLENIISGTMVGLAASGGFAGMKSVTEAVSKGKA